MTDWSECEAISELQAQLLIDWGLEGKVLQKSSEENEQLRPGQLFSQAGSLSCETGIENESFFQLILVHGGTDDVHNILLQILI